MKTLKKISLLIIMLLSVLLLVPINTDAAEKKVSKASISAKTKGDTVTIMIKKTDKAEGYEIYVKAPGDKKYQKYDTISQDGSKERTYTYTAKKEGDYQFKVRGYKKENGKTKYGNYSKAVKVSIEKEKSGSSRTVYITKTGKCYHYKNNCGNGTYTPIDLEVAIKKYSPCKKCVK